MANTKPKVIVILGPTATGKSDLAVKLARKFRGEVISADSRQIYKGVNVGSDKITTEEMGGIRHYLIDVASPKRRFMVTQYKKLAEKAIRDICRRGNPPKFRGAKLDRARIPIICGGTGLYIDVLIQNWKLPAVKPNLKLRRELEKKSAEELFSQLKKLDPKRAGNIDRLNKRRLVRALEVVIETGKSSHSNILQNIGMSKYDVLKIGITVATEELKRRIKKRTLQRLRGGVIQEMENLRKVGVGEKKLDEVSLYYRWVRPYLRGEMNQEKTLELITTKIWQYAKRQMTWFKRDKNINWISKNAEAEKLVKKFL